MKRITDALILEKKKEYIARVRAEGRKNRKGFYKMVRNFCTKESSTQRFEPLSLYIPWRVRANGGTENHGVLRYDLRPIAKVGHRESTYGMSRGTVW